jgi:hypothetical protein
MLQIEFEIDKISNEFRVFFMRRLSDKAEANKWRSANIRVGTNSKQDAFLFTHTPQAQKDTHQDIMDCLDELKKEFSFDTRVLKKGISIEITDIRYSE